MRLVHFEELTLKTLHLPGRCLIQTQERRGELLAVSGRVLDTTLYILYRKITNKVNKKIKNRQQSNAS